MSDFTNSTNMSLPIPTVGIAGGPLWATLLNSCLTTLDAHSHVSGSGVQITPAAININADLTMAANNLTDARSLRMESQVAPIAAAADLGCLYVVSDDLYYNDVSGNSIRLTQAGSIVGTAGSITGLASPASASFSASTFVWQSDTNIAASMDMGTLILRNTTPNSTYAVTVSPPAALAANAAITLPSAPASNLPVSMDSSGVMTAAQVTLAQLVAAVQASLVPAGTILSYGGATAPTGYLLCDGKSYAQATYAALFTAIGTAFGAAGSNFNVPDLRGQFLRGVTSISTVTGAGSASSNQATFTAHGFNRTGFAVRVISGTLTGLSAGVTYYVIVVDANTLAFATSSTLAIVGTRITISGSNSAVLRQWEDPDVTSRTLITVGGNGTGGTAGIGSAQGDQIAQHTHPLAIPIFTSVGSGAGGSSVGVNSTPSISATSSFGGNETRPQNVYVQYIIKT